MTGRQIVAGIDIDDVLYPWYYRAHDICVRERLTMGDVIPSTWSPHLEYGVELEDWIKVLGFATLSGELYSGDPIPGALEALHVLRDEGVRIELITARGFMQHGDEIKFRTREWLAEWKVPHDGLYFTRDKPAVARDLHVTHFIDDNLGNVRAMSEEFPSARTYLQDRPWNQDADFPVRRLANMTEFTEVITKGAHPWLTSTK